MVVWGWLGTGLGLAWGWPGGALRAGATEHSRRWEPTEYVVVTIPLSAGKLDMRPGVHQNFG
ncbi:hypothetical protein JOE65_001280 [Arthrobacter roseus]|nr:hypothetical protein [Arthrobacter roseus]